jgi:hypothetical protein
MKRPGFAMKRCNPRAAGAADLRWFAGLRLETGRMSWRYGCTVTGGSGQPICPIMQMGPTLLPTPLSPARGSPVPCETSGGPSASLSSGHTWRPMSGSARPILRLVSCDWRIRVSSPALAPASGFRSCPAASAQALRPRFSLPCADAWPRPRPFADPGLRLIRLAPSLPPVSARSPSLSGEPASRPSQTSPLAFGRGLFQAVSR